MKYFAVSDVHSFLTPLKKALQLAGFDYANSDHKLVVCGDLFDRGNETIELFSFVKELANQNRLIYVRGNHEDLLFKFLDEYQQGLGVYYYHVSNGTLNTVSHLTGLNYHELRYGIYSYKEVRDRLENVLKFINTHSIDFFELKDTIFVHGWIPQPSSHVTSYRDGDWERARWLNGFIYWKNGVIPEGKTVVCGHIHSSFAWHNFEKLGTEHGPDACYNSYIADGIVGLDTCTVLSNRVNCVVFDDNGKIIENV